MLLIDEIVLPERDATAQGAQHDVEVMICVGMYTESRFNAETLYDFPTRYGVPKLKVLQAVSNAQRLNGKIC